MATITEIIARLDARIYELLDDVDNITSYKLGDKSVSKTEALKALTDLRDKYQAMAEKEPYEDITNIAFDFSDFGEEQIEFIGDGE